MAEPRPDTASAPDDALSPLYRQLRDTQDSATWADMLRTQQRPSSVQGPDDVQRLVATIAPEYGVDPRLVEAVIGLESGGQAQAISRQGGQGLMQLMPGTSRRFGVSDPMDPVQNITGGVRYLAALQQRFPGRLDLQLAGYHAGEGAVKAAGGRIPDTTDGQMRTGDYVTAILGRYKALGGLYAGPDVAPTATRLPTPYEAFRAWMDERPLLRGGGPATLTRADVLRLPQEETRLRQRSAPALPGEGDRPPLTLSPLDQARLDSSGMGRPLQVETDVDTLTARVAGQPTALLPGQQPLRQGGPGEEALTESEPFRSLGNFAAAGIQGVRTAIQGISAWLGTHAAGHPEDKLGALSTQATRSGLAAVAGVVRDGEQAVAVRLPPGEQPSFWDKLMSGFGSAGASVFTGLLTGGSGWAAALGGGVFEALQEAGTLHEQLVPLVGDAEASKRAMKSFGTNLLLVTLTDRLGIFGEETRLLRRTLNGIVTNGLQEAVQYDIERRQMWVPGSHPAAAALLLQGWQRQGDRVVQPFVPQDAGEVALLGMLVGGAAAAGVHQLAQQTVGPLEALANLLPSPQPGLPAGRLRRGERGSTGVPSGGQTAAELLAASEGAGGAQLPPATPATPAPDEPGTPPGPAPTIRLGAEGLTPERYKTPAGQWRIPLRDMPSQELELQDLIRQGDAEGRRGIRIEGEELHGELHALISRTESGLSGLQNNTSGLSLQQMAERAHELGFIPTPDKASLLEALDRSVTQSQPVYSVYATGHVPLIDDPRVQASYQAVLDATAAMQARTAEQVGGTRTHAVVHAEAEQMIASGQWSLEDVRELFPGVVLTDTQVSALLQSLNTLGEQMDAAAQAYLDGGERLGSQEETTLQSIMGLFAELDSIRLGVSATQSRGLGIMNDPLRAYTAYLNALHQALLTAPYRTMGQMARKIVAARRQPVMTPEALRNNPALQAQWLEQTRKLQEAVARMEGVSPNIAWQPQIQQALPLPSQQGMTEADWQRLKTHYDALFALEHAAQPAAPAGMDAARWQQLKEAYSAWHAASQGGELLSADPLFPGRGPWRTAAEWQAALDAFYAQAQTDLGVRLDQALNPWRATSTQLPLFKAMLQSTRPGFAPYFLELWYNAILSNPSTPLANAIGNTIATGWVIPERWIASTYDTQGGVARGEATAMLYGLTHGIQDAWAVALRSFQLGAPQSGVGREFAREPVATAQNLGLDPTSPMGRFADFWFEYIGVASGGRLPSRLLMASDEFFKMLNYRMELNALAYREASRLGYEGTAWAEHVQRVVSSPQLSQIEQAAQDFSVLQTFQTALQPFQPGSRTLGGAIQALSEVEVLGFPVGKMLLPFVQTPANIARYALERTPLGYLFRSVRDDIAAGGARGDIAQAKITLGTMTMVGLVGLAMAGKLVGRAPEDPTLRRIFLDMHPEYSVNIGGRWLALDRLEPVGMLATFVADAVQIAGEVQVPLYERGIAMLWYPFLKNIASKTYMRGLSDFFDAVSPHPGDKTELTMERAFRYARRQVMSVAHPSALAASAARVLDPFEKDIGSIVDAWYARVPGWSRSVPARRSLDGEKILPGNGIAPGLLSNTVRAFYPMRMGEGTLTAADAAIQANKMSIAALPRTLTARALRPGEAVQVDADVNLRDYPALRLSPAQYERYQVLASGNQARARELGLQIPDQALRAQVESLANGYSKPPPHALMHVGEFLDWVTTTPEYQEATPGPGGGREDLFQGVVGVYRQLGKQLLLAHDDALRTQYEQTQQQHALQKIPRRQRPAVQQQRQQEFNEAAPQIRRDLGLQIGAPR